MQFIATASRGTEPALFQELRAMGLDATLERGHVTFEGDLEAGYLACLHSRVASRVLMLIARIHAQNAGALYRGVNRLPWEDHIRKRGTLAVDFVGSNPSIRNSLFGARKVKDAIVDRIRYKCGGVRPDVDLDEPEVRINVHLSGKLAHVCLDMGGGGLHARGWGRDGGSAPIKETLAAGILHLAGWPEAARAGTMLCDPMCGSGTFALEAVGMARGQAPGLSRKRWGFDHWMGHEAGTWGRLVDDARSVEMKDVPPIVLMDWDPDQLDRAHANLKRADMLDGVELVLCDLAKATPPAERGLMVTNPPYGQRLEEDDLYPEIGNVLRRRFLGWTAWVLAGSPKLGRRLGLKAFQRVALFNGPIECRLVGLRISERPVERDRD